MTTRSGRKYKKAEMAEKETTGGVGVADMMWLISEDCKRREEEGAHRGAAMARGGARNGGKNSEGCNGHCWTATPESFREVLHTGGVRLRHQIPRSCPSQVHKCRTCRRGAGATILSGWGAQGNSHGSGLHLHLTTPQRDLSFTTSTFDPDNSIPPPDRQTCGALQQNPIKSMLQKTATEEGKD